MVNTLTFCKSHLNFQNFKFQFCHLIFNTYFRLTLYKICAFPVRMCIPGEAHPHSWRVTSPIPSEDLMNHNGINILTGNGDMTHRECKSSLGMGMCLTGNGDVPPRECTSSQGMGMCLTGNIHLHWESISSPGMHIVYTE